MLRPTTFVRRLFPRVLLPVLVLAALAQGLAVPPAAAQEWTVNRAKSQVTLQVSIDGQPVTGRFGGYRFDIRFDPEEPADGTITAQIDASSISTGDPALDAKLYGPDWLNAGAHPTIRLKSVRIRGREAPNFRLEADVTLKGVTKRVATPIAMDDRGDGGRVQAEIPINAAAFGIGQGAEGMIIGIDLAATHLTN